MWSRRAGERENEKIRKVGGKPECRDHRIPELRNTEVEELRGGKWRAELTSTRRYLQKRKGEGRELQEGERQGEGQAQGSLKRRPPVGQESPAAGPGPRRGRGRSRREGSGIYGKAIHYPSLVIYPNN
jgi:hypothetical protein